jgi:predicted DsbA family dithiol-disulfide isomerase
VVVLFRQRKMNVVEITYFSDVLCVWAYVSQARIDAVKEKFGAAVRIENRFCSVFGDTARDYVHLEGQRRI